MTVRLSVRTAIWRSHVARTVGEVDGLVPVVKGNGYGFGRGRLAALAAEFSDTIAVGTVHELDVVPPGVHAVVLTPVLAASFENPEIEELIGTRDPILTVSNADHVAVLGGDGWHGRVVVKASTSMQRYGVEPASVASLIDDARAHDLDVVGVSLHPPLVGDAGERRAQIVDALEHVDPALPVWVSHLDPDSYATLPDTHHYRLRLGTGLWHGDKSTLHLSADVVETRRVRAGDRAGYRLGAIPTDGHLVMIGAGTANGVTPLPDGRSPFHFERARLALHEPPHMHTSMAFVPTGDPLPEMGERVDLQRPLTMTIVDEYEWL
ncbi:MAG: alanine racemase [Ilumatobacter sp.]